MATTANPGEAAFGKVARGVLDSLLEGCQVISLHDG